MPKRIEELTVADLERSRWCVYHNDEEGYDSFEFVIPDNHPDYSEHVIEVELAHFAFSDGKTYKGLFDGSESFSVSHNGHWYSFWYGVSKPSISAVNEFKEFLTANHLALPVLAKAAWSGTSRTYNGLQYLDDTAAIRELVI
ncbi:hypothetical protein [Pseudomonas duriflava]|uniref:hypothetical protein n=1 Tax=Pseudomonas duriflava TaxID=459528 RepID=UPI0011A50FC6|nr:hypothetical protein [Pseudomonas duriflava]